MAKRGSFSINEWCQRHAVCRATYYNLQKRGEGPEIMNIGNRVRISAEADKRWVKKQEAAAAGLPEIGHNGGAPLAGRARRPRVPIDGDE